MQIIRSIAKMQSLSRRLVAEGKRIGLVPTMGYLHEGHLSLIRRAKKQTHTVITTIFVNPAQFAPTEDLSRYPRDEKGDVRKIKSAGGDIVFVPDVSEIYPSDFQTYVVVEKLTQTLEGSARPDHFRCVTTIVAKLFNITRPDLVVFGQKDFQQARVLERMTTDLGYPIKYIISPTVRERDGLAMSSRNAYFDAEGRKEALALFQALQAAKMLVRSEELSATKVEQEMCEVILKISPEAEIDYIAFTDFETLSSSPKIAKGTYVSMAVRIRGVRLIDNLKLL